MGLIYSNARLLMTARRDGFSFDRVATIGRQQLFVRRQELESLADEFGMSRHDVRSISAPWGGYADDFLRQCLGSQRVDSIDYSDYESASIIHDLNQPIDEFLRQSFDVVFDGGTLEHVFNLPVALANCMEMVRIGGCLLLSTTANNHCGHGFYQFSPELFFRVFQSANGFELQKVLLIEHPFPGVELSGVQRCYEVIDPDAAGCRVGLVSNTPVMIQVLAKRISDAPIFASPPQQSDYQRLWESSVGHRQSPRETNTNEGRLPPGGRFARLRRIAGNLKRGFGKRLPVSAQQWFTGRRQRREYSLQNRRFYRPW